MLSRPRFTLTLAGMLSAGWSMAAGAQMVEARIGRFFDSDGWTSYRLGMSRPLGGWLGIQIHGDVLRRYGGDAGQFTGLGMDLTAFRRGEDGPYALIGLSGGLGSESSNNFSDPWGSWTIGAGYDVFPVSFLSVGAEARWRQLSLGGRQGMELAGGLTIYLSGGSPSPKPMVREIDPPAEVLSTQPQSPPRTLVDSVILTAREAMGRPYEYGGTGENGEGFDCSGLIQYAYGKHGIALPRRSTDQAREGIKVDRKPEALRAGDLLTFSNRGGAVTHVGLYLGERRFIHSATRGVQISTLSPEDPYGRWWYKRWVGVRRIVP